MTTRLMARLEGIFGRARRCGGYVGDLVSELTLGHPGSVRGDRGATAVEYALMVGLIAVVIVVSVALFGHNVSQLFYVPASVFEHP